MLTEDQISEFWEKGFIVARGGCAPDLVDGMRADIEAWTEESRGFDENYGEILGGKARFDLQPGHTAERPQLRRVNNPVDVSESYRKALFEGSVVDMSVDLIGPDVVFHHCKLNIKVPGAATRVDYHQDHAFTPHTNDDMLTVMILLDDMDEANGCLKIVPGSHRERHTHWQGEHFMGRIDPAMDEDFDARAEPIVGNAGDVCYMHNWAVHGSEENTSERNRSLLIADFVAADAKPLSPNPVPTAFEGRVLAGKASKVARLTQPSLELPENYGNDSFFSIQERDADARKAEEGEPA